MIGLDFFVDKYGLLLSALFVFVGLMSFIYALGTMREKGHRLEYYLMLLLIVGSGVGVALTYNILLIFVFWEISTFAAWRAVAYYRRPAEIEASTITFVINFVAATILLIGILMIYLDNGTFSIFGISRVSEIAAVFVMVGIMTKSVTVPLHIWLAPAYGAIPTALGGSLAGVAENIGVILFLRLFTLGGNGTSGFITVVCWIAVVSSIVGGGVALRSNKLRNLLAFSTISQVGFILLGFAVGGLYGTVGGVLYIIAHALAKSGLFYGVGLIEDVTGEDDLTQMSCMLKLSPVLTVGMALLAGSIVGFFPMIGFFSKLGVIIGAVEHSNYLGIGAIVAAVVTLLYNTRFYHEVFFGEKCDLVKTKIKLPNYVGVAVVFVLALLSLLLGIFFYEPLTYLIGGGL
jgi:formate hydrogenlyase subunit 3/multisubunit Na+/H+ antiporter MnhD subunit